MLLHLRNLPSYSDVHKLERRLGVIEKQVPALLTGTRTDVVRIPAGHISITCGRQATKVSIPAILQWIRRHSEPLV